MQHKTVASDDVAVRDYSRYGDVNEYIGLLKGKEFLAYRQDWQAASRMEKEYEFPLFLVFETSFRCNLRCIMCIHSSSERSKYAYIEKFPYGKFGEIMREASKYRCPSLTIGGTSEPLMDNRIGRMLGLARESGFLDTMINTNATLLTERVGRELIENGLTRLRVGFDGATAETYERIRIGADFEKVKKNIINFVKLRDAIGSKLPVVRISCVELSENGVEIDEFVNFWRPIVDCVSIQRYRPHEFTDERSRKRMGAGEAVIGNVFCSQPFERLYIRGNGDAHACCNIVYGPRMGNIFKKSVYEIWNSDVMKGLRRCIKNGDLDRIPVCKECMKYTYGAR